MNDTLSPTKHAKNKVGNLSPTIQIFTNTCRGK